MAQNAAPMFKKAKTTFGYHPSRKNRFRSKDGKRGYSIESLDEDALVDEVDWLEWKAQWFPSEQSASILLQAERARDRLRLIQSGRDDDS